jgi:hypothetical protein
MNVTATNNLQQANQHSLMAALARCIKRYNVKRGWRKGSGQEQEEEYFRLEMGFRLMGHWRSFAQLLLSDFERMCCCCALGGT